MAALHCVSTAAPKASPGAINRPITSFQHSRRQRATPLAQDLASYGVFAPVSRSHYVSRTHRSQNGATTALEGGEQEIPAGLLNIDGIQEHDVGAASVVLTRAFAVSPQGVPIQDGRRYCESMLTMPPKGLLLVGKLRPKEETDAVDWLRPGTKHRVVATATISFHPDSREEFPSLQPPADCAFLCNIAVDPSFRRQGIARHMLTACETLARSRGFRQLFLHIRLGDGPARSLYESSGFHELDADSWLVKVRGLTPRALMVKGL